MTSVNDSNSTETLFKTWRMKFKLLCFNEETEKNLSFYNKLFDGLDSSKQCLEKVAADVDLSFFAIDMCGGLSFFHNPVQFGGNIRRPVPTFTALCGLDNKASCVKLFDFVATNDISFHTPPLDSFRQCSSKEEICALDVPPPLENLAEANNPLLLQKPQSSSLLPSSAR